MIGLSVVVITKDEARRIAACLESVAWADEIIVVDDQSADATREIAARFTDKIFVRPLDGFSQQKQFGVDQARGPWILSLDADERIPADLAQEIRQVIARDTSHAAFRIWRKSFYLGRWIRHGDWYVPIVRLFRKDKARFNGRLVHETPVVSGEVGCLTRPFLHETYDSVQQHMAKLNLYSTLDARVFFEAGRRIRRRNTLAAFVLKPVYVFFRKYILQRAFLDGLEGLLISWMTVLNVIATHMKLWEMTKKEAGAAR